MIEKPEFEVSSDGSGDGHNLEPAALDPSGDVPDPTPVDGRCEQTVRRLGVYHFPDDDDDILAPSLMAAITVWREYHGFNPDIDPCRVEVHSDPDDLIQAGDREET